MQSFNESTSFDQALGSSATGRLYCATLQVLHGKIYTVSSILQNPQYKLSNALFQGKTPITDTLPLEFIKILYWNDFSTSG